MNQKIEIPGIKKVLYEQVFVGGYYDGRMTTKVYFKDGSAVTFAGSLSKKEARSQACFEKARDAGMTAEETEAFLKSKRPIR
jgi:hypothetical protein